MSLSFFDIEHRDGDDWFRPTDACRGPWDADACHGGPPTGLMARASERAVPEQRLVRVTVDLIRPIPHAGFRIDVTVSRRGRTVSTTEIAIVDGDGRRVVTARCMHLAEEAMPNLPTADETLPRLADAVPGTFGVAGGAHGLPMFSRNVEMRYPEGEDHLPGPTTAWMRTLPLLPDETPSGFQRICPLADCGNAISRNAEPTAFAFVNTDLTIYVHREPTGEWFGSRSVSRWESDGLGMSDSLLFDDDGPVGRAIQAIVIRPVG